jgi:hypothetical protein
MAKGIVYLCHPKERSLPGVQSWAASAIAVATAAPEWEGWTVKTVEYDHACALTVTDFCSEVCGRLGPVVLIEPVQGRVFQLLRERLGTRIAIVREAVDGDADILGLLEKAKTHHESGDPPVPRRFAVALLLLRKLDQEHMWCGNAKGYMYAEDIPKGRGLDEQFSDAVPSVLSLLYQAGLLLQKTKRYGSKYGLNPDRREQIYQILRERRFTDAHLAQVLARDGHIESARVLDLLDSYAVNPRA